MTARRGLYQLAGNANAIARFPDASFQHIAHAQFASDPLDVDGLAFVGEARIAGDDEQGLEARQRGDDVINHAVREILLLRIAAHVLERQNRDGGLVGEREGLARACGNIFRNLRSRRSGYLHSPGAHRLGNILQRLRTHIFQGDTDLAADLALGVIGDADAAGLCDSLKARGDVDAVAENIVVVDNDVADVNADAEFDPDILRHAGVLRGHAPLDFYGAFHGIDRAGELDQHAVACGLDDAA